MTTASNSSRSYTTTNPYANPIDHPFLHALDRAAHGSLQHETPEGAIHLFGERGTEPQAYWKIYDWQALDDTISQGQIGFAEGYIDEKWHTDDLTSLITFLLLNDKAIEKYFYGKPWYALSMKLKHFLNKNSISGSRRNIMSHYDLGNDFYSLWLDDSMTYSCALFNGDDTLSLEHAQQAKYNRILDKLSAKPGDTILEIGCGWGGFMQAAAKKGIHVTGITISEAQKAYAEKELKEKNLDHLAEIKLIDYRLIKGQFDYIVSIGMFEHVGQAYWPEYFNLIKANLKPGGKAMVQTITLDETVFKNSIGKTGFIEKYIFPGGELPSPPRFARAAENAGLECRELFAFGKDYARTLSHWLTRFENQKDQVKKLGYDERFIRIWRFYLECCIASFMTERTSLMQAELVKSS